MSDHVGNYRGHHLFTVGEAAETLKLHVKTVRRKIRDGDIRSVRVGKQYRIPQDALEEFVGHALTIEPARPARTARHVFVTTVVTIDAISAEDSSRLTNTLMAALGSGRTGSRVDCVYREDVGQLRVIVNGALDVTRDLLDVVNVLVSREA